MKKLILGLGLLAGTFAFAQTTKPAQFGIKAGINVSSISKDGYESTNSKVGFQGGVFANVPLSESFNFQPEVLYSQLGAKVEYKLANFKYTKKLNMGYISIPLMFQYRFVPEFYVEAGPEFGFLAHSEINDKLKAGDLEKSKNTDTKERFNTFNFGLGVGLGYDIIPNFGINARYNIGYTDITKKNKTLEKDPNNRNSAFQFGVYYKF